MAQSLATFLAAVASASGKYAGQYGLTPQELQLALITTAGVEGGLGETTGVGDGGLSHGRYQFYEGGGHGTSLINQGWTRADFYDDAKVVDHWAPLLAQSVANAKAQGYTGGEALRRGAFALERPAQIYDAGSFNAVLERASGLMGGAPVASAQASGSTTMSDAATQEIRAAMLAKVKAAQAKANAFGATKEDYAAFQKALIDLGLFEDAVYNPSESGGSATDPAQQAFDNALKLADLEGEQADRMYARWRDKSESARVATEAEITGSGIKNKLNAENEANALLTNNQGPRSNIATYHAPKYEDALEKWKKKFNVGEEPTGTGAGTSGIIAPSVGDRAAAAASIAAPVIPTGTLGTDAPPANNEWVIEDQVPSKPDSDKPWWQQNPTGATPKEIGGAIVTGGAKAPAAIAKGAKKWWQTSKSNFKFGVPSWADGTMNHPGGPAFINEQGPETIVPAFGQPYIAQGGAHVANLDHGAAVIPAGVPPEEAMAFAQIRQGMNNPQAQDPAQQQMEQQARANDPELQAKVIAALKKAMAAHSATNPPTTPRILGPQEDLWTDWRPLTGIPAQPLNEAGMPPGGGPPVNPMPGQQNPAPPMGVPA